MREIPLAVWRLMVAYAFMMGGTALTVLIAGIISLDLAPAAGLATLPVALTVVGVAASTLPTGRLLDRFGRPPVFIAYGVLALLAALLCAYALWISSFWLYCLAALAMGWAAAAGHQYRFAALEQVPATLAPQATSVLLLGGILGAFIGPELAVRGKTLMAVPYVGSYLLLAAAYAVGIAIIAFHREAPLAAEARASAERPLGVILRQPVLLLAIGAGAAAYGVMTFIMTATPISMHSHAGHSLESTKWVIQSHIAGMYLPSLLFGLLAARFGLQRLLWAGLAAFVLTLLIALAGQGFMNYWLALVLLGIGWNFLFLAGTNLLPRGYRPSERFRVQAVNDFLIFSVQALVALGSGWFLMQFQWPGVLAAAGLPVVLFAWLLLFTQAFHERG